MGCGAEMAPRPDTILLQGGLDLTAPRIVANDGRLISGRNYEPDHGGYRRFQGYERFDGRTRPSDRGFLLLPWSEWVAGTPEVGDRIVGRVSGAEATVLDPLLVTGLYQSVHDAGWLPVCEVFGDFVDEELVDRTAPTADDAFGVIIGSRSASLDYSAVPADYLDSLAAKALARQQAQESARRSAIGAAGGAGGNMVLATMPLRSDWFSIVQDGETAYGQLRKSTVAGWETIDVGATLAFEGGAFVPSIGTTIVQGAVSGVVSGYWYISGDVAADTLVGRVVVKQIAGGGFTAGSAYHATHPGDVNWRITLLNVVDNRPRVFASAASGVPVRISHVSGNIEGGGAAERLFFTEPGRGPRMFDGATLTYIEFGDSATLGYPSVVALYADHLFLGFDSGSLLHSAIGDPVNWETANGSGEIAFKAAITNIVQDRGSLVIFCRDSIHYLRGTSASDWQRDIVTEQMGAEPGTAVVAAGRILFVANGQIMALDAVETFGNWRASSISQQIEPWLNAKRDRGATCVLALPVPSKDLVRFFFSDGDGLTLFLGRGQPEWAPLRLPIVVQCGAVNSDGAAMVGTKDGWVYELDRGRTFDGDPVEAMVRLPFMHLGQPHVNKRWHGVTLEVEAPGAVSLTLAPEFDYGDPAAAPSSILTATMTAQGDGAFWDEGLWDAGSYDRPMQGVVSADINGLGRNMTLGIQTTSANEPPHMLQSLTVDWSPRGRKRRAV